jgi:hypothetical protein
MVLMLELPLVAVAYKEPMEVERLEARSSVLLMPFDSYVYHFAVVG